MGRRITLNNYFKNTLLKIIILIVKNKNLIVNSSSRYEIIILFKKSFIIFFARSSLFEKNFIYIKILFNSIFKKSIIMLI